MEMHDYPLVLGMEFLKEAKASFPSLNLMQIRDFCVGISLEQMSILRRIIAMRVLPCEEEAKVATERRKSPLRKEASMKKLSPSCFCGGCQMPKKASHPKARRNLKRKPRGKGLRATYGTDRISWLLVRAREPSKPSKHRRSCGSKSWMRVLTN